MDIDEISTWAGIVAGITGILVLAAVPLAIIEIRIEVRLAREAKTLREFDPEPKLTRRQIRYRDHFIKTNTQITTFGDGRRITAPIAAIIRPTTGSIETLTYALQDPNEPVE